MNEEQDWTDPQFCLGAVLAQIEDLDHAGKLRVLQEALDTVENES